MLLLLLLLCLVQADDALITAEEEAEYSITDIRREFKELDELEEVGAA